MLEELKDQNRTIITLLQRQLAQTVVNEINHELPRGLKIPEQSVQESECLSAETEDSDVRGKLVQLCYSIPTVFLQLTVTDV